MLVRASASVPQQTPQEVNSHVAGLRPAGGGGIPWTVPPGRLLRETVVGIIAPLEVDVADQLARLVLEGMWPPLQVARRQHLRLRLLPGPLLREESSRERDSGEHAGQQDAGRPRCVATPLALTCGQPICQSDATRQEPRFSALRRFCGGEMLRISRFSRKSSRRSKVGLRAGCLGNRRSILLSYGRTAEGGLAAAAGLADTPMHQNISALADTVKHRGARAGAASAHTLAVNGRFAYS